MRENVDIVRCSKVFALDGERQLWLFKRLDTALYRPTTWDLLGGGLEEGEDFKDAAIREVNEESGGSLNLTRQDLLRFYSSNLPSRQGTHINQRVFYTVDITQNPANWRLPNHSEAKGCTPDQASELLTHPPLAQALSVLIERVWDVKLSVV